MYPVTTPYGQVAGYPLNNGFHNGIDYGYPMGTPVIVNGVEIGTSNNTGTTTGPHLHVGKFVNGVVQDPGVGNGFSFDSAIVYDTGEDSVNGIFVRITGDGALWNYLHLERVSVTKGQVLKGESMQPTAAQIDQTIAIAHQAVFGTPAPDIDFNNLRPLLSNNYPNGVIEMLTQYNASPEAAWRQNTLNATTLNPGLYKVQ
jgi:hypothetical protein